MMLFTLAFWKDAGERAVRTFAQSEVVLLGATQGGLVHVPWTAQLSVSGLAALVSILNSIVAPARNGQAVAASPAAVEPDPADPVTSGAPG